MLSSLQFCEPLCPQPSCDIRRGKRRRFIESACQEAVDCTSDATERSLSWPVDLLDDPGQLLTVPWSILRKSEDRREWNGVVLSRITCLCSPLAPVQPPELDWRVRRATPGASHPVSACLLQHLTLRNSSVFPWPSKTWIEILHRGKESPDRTEFDQRCSCTWRPSTEASWYQ